jgi:hypothetical protein
LTAARSPAVTHEHGLSRHFGWRFHGGIRSSIASSGGRVWLDSGAPAPVQLRHKLGGCRFGKQPRRLAELFQKHPQAAVVRQALIRDVFTHGAGFRKPAVPLDGAQQEPRQPVRVASAHEQQVARRKFVKQFLRLAQRRLEMIEGSELVFVRECAGRGIDTWFPEQMIHNRLRQFLSGLRQIWMALGA